MRTLHVSVREARMAVERVLLTCGLPSGYVHGVRECILLSQALGLGGLKALLEGHTALRMDAFADIRLADTGDGITVDAAGLHAWLLLPTLVDLAVEMARRSGSAKATVLNVGEPGELRVSSALAKHYGSEIGVSGNLLRARNASRPRNAEQRDPLLFAAMRDGFDVEESLWRAVHKLSDTALAPDSVVSRRHAGPVILTDDGRIAGRLPQDDDFDMNMLKKVAL